MFQTSCSNLIKRSLAGFYQLRHAIKPIKQQINREVHTTQKINNNFNVNTNVTKDVILFKYENPRFYKLLNFFAISQFFFWNYLSHFSFTKLKDAPVERNTDPDLPFWRKMNLGDNKYRNSLTIFCFLIGELTFGLNSRFVYKVLMFLFRIWSLISCLDVYS